MIRSDITDQSDGQQGRIASLEFLAESRRQIVTTLQADLINYGLTLGLTPAQIEEKIDDLFSAFAAEWFLYLLIGSESLATAITNDVALGWLNTEAPPASGISLRTRITDRLS